MGIFSSNKEKDELMLVFDVRSSSVGGALFRVQKSGVPKIVFSVREPTIIQKDLDVDRFLSLTIKSLSNIASRISMMGMGVPVRIFCVLSSPWYVSQTRLISFKKDTPFVFTSKLADDLIQKEIHIFEEEHLTKYEHGSHKVRSIELKNVKTTLNGYETSYPLDKKVQELEMTVFISMAPEQVLLKIEETVKKYFHFKNIKFISSAMSSFVAVRDIFMNQENFLLIDIEGEVADIFMVKKNILRESISFPFGCNFIIRGISSALNCSLEEAESFFSLFKDEHSEPSTEKKLTPIINKLKTEWLQEFQKSLANISNDISIPSTIFLSVDKNFTKFFGKLIETEQFNQYAFTESKFEIIFLDTEILHNTVVFEKDTIRDPFIIIDSVYINHFLIHPVMTGQA